MRVLYVSAVGGAGMGRAAQRYFPVEVARRGAEVAMVGEVAAAEVKAIGRCFELGRDWRSLRRRITSLRRIVGEVRPDIVHVFRHVDCEVYPLACGASGRPTWIVDARTPILATGAARLPSQMSGWASGLVYDARAAHAEAVGRRIFGRRDVTVLPPGYDDGIFFPGPRPRALERDGALRLIYIGSLEARRQVLGALAALVDFASNQPPGARLRPTIDVYGEGAEDAAIHGLAARSNGALRHRGALPQGELAARLREYDVGLSLILNPVYREAPPLKTIEYLASGLPVIASDTPGNRLYVHEGVNGWLVDGRPETLRERLTQLCNEGPLAGMAEAAAASIEGCSWSSIVETRLLPLYEACLADRRGARPSRVAHA